MMKIVCGASLLIVFAMVSPSAADERPFSVVSVLTHQHAFDRPHDIELQGDLAFVPGKGGSLAIVDIKNPRQPRIVWHRHDPDELEEAETVLLAKDRLYLGTHDFHSIDITDSGQPVFQAHITDRSRMLRINGMVRRGDTILTACKDGWLNAVDVSLAAEPRLVGGRNIREEYGVGWPHDVDLYQQYAVVPDPQRFGLLEELGKLAVIRVWDPAANRLLPSEDWELVGLVSSNELIGANRVQVSGHHAYVGASTTETGNGGQFIVVDVSTPSSPRQIAAVPFAEDDGRGPNGLTIAGQVVFLAGGQSVEAIDVSDPSRPMKLAGQRFKKELAGARDSGHDLIYRDGYLFVTGQNDHCLLTLRVESQRIRDLAD